MFRMIDLFSGLGGASQAMLEHPDWDVIRIDNNPLLLQYAPTTQIAYVENLDVTAFIDVDLVWASPPCTDFSEGFNSPKCKHRRSDSEEEYQPDMTLVQMTLDFIKAVKPRYWIIENVKGAIKFFEPLLGGPKVIIGPYCLWGDFPLFDAKLPSGYSKNNDEDEYGRILRSNARAKIPFEISEALRQTIQYQTRLDSFSKTPNRQ
jgi:hypothetical protein